MCVGLITYCLKFGLSRISFIQRVTVDGFTENIRLITSLLPHLTSTRSGFCSTSSKFIITGFGMFSPLFKIIIQKEFAQSNFGPSSKLRSALDELKLMVRYPQRNFAFGNSLIVSRDEKSAGRWMQSRFATPLDIRSAEFST